MSNSNGVAWFQFNFPRLSPTLVPFLAYSEGGRDRLLVLRWYQRRLTIGLEVNPGAESIPARPEVCTAGPRFQKRGNFSPSELHLAIAIIII